MYRAFSKYCNWWWWWWWWWAFPSKAGRLRSVVEGGSDPLVQLLRLVWRWLDKCQDFPCPRWSFPEPTVETSSGRVSSADCGRGLCVRWELLPEGWKYSPVKEIGEQEVCVSIGWMSRRGLWRNRGADNFELPSRPFQLISSLCMFLKRSISHSYPKYSFNKQNQNKYC